MGHRKPDMEAIERRGYQYYDYTILDKLVISVFSVCDM